MDIDLLVTPEGEAGLLSNENLIKKAVGIIFDTENGVLSLEFVDMDHLDLNIPVEESFYATLDANPQIHLGSVQDGKIAQAYQVPLMFLDDPYRAEAFENTEPPPKPLDSFYYFVQHCVLGQPVHRADAGNEDTLGCILGDNAPSSLQFAHHLARRHGLEAQNANTNVNTHSVNTPGLGMGGASGGSGGTYYQRGKQNKHYDTRKDKKDD